MASENKKKKMKNSFCNHGFSLKEKNIKLKRLLFYNSALRKKLNGAIKDE